MGRMNFFEINGSKLSAEIVKFLQKEAVSQELVENSVKEMSNNIKQNGFKAIADYTKLYDKFDLTEENFRVSKKEIAAIASRIDKELSKSLEIAVERVRKFHEKQTDKNFEYIDDCGCRMGQVVVPIDSAAVYVPGGKALYPSTVYMTVVPALIAGVKRIVLLSPPRTFIESPEVARLIEILGIDEIYRGAGAALVLGAVHGAGQLAKVDKITGPGNAYVAKAKQLSYGLIDIDMIAGPSDITVIADTSDDKDIVPIASDLLSQAEHDPDARVVLIGTDKEFLLRIESELFRQANLIPNKEIALDSIINNGMIIKVNSISDAVAVSNEIAPEHLELYSDDPHALLKDVRYAGSVFLGKFTPESAGDYLGGPNHVLPTSGTARFFSPLGVYSFTKRYNYLEFTDEALKKYGGDITRIARQERLEAHARAVESRYKSF